MYRTFPHTPVAVRKVKLSLGISIVACVILGVCAAVLIVFG